MREDDRIKHAREMAEKWKVVSSHLRPGETLGDVWHRLPADVRSFIEKYPTGERLEGFFGADLRDLIPILSPAKLPGGWTAEEFEEFEREELEVFGEIEDHLGGQKMTPDAIRNLPQEFRDRFLVLAAMRCDQQNIA